MSYDTAVFESWRRRFRREMPARWPDALAYHRHQPQGVCIDVRMTFARGLCVVTYTRLDGHECWLDLSATVAEARDRARSLGWTINRLGRNPTPVERDLKLHIPLSPHDPHFPDAVLEAVKRHQRPVVVRLAQDMDITQVVVATVSDYWLRTFDTHDEAHAFVRDHGLNVLDPHAS